MKRTIVWLTLLITAVLFWFYSMNIYGLQVDEKINKEGYFTYYEKEKFIFLDNEGDKYLLKLPKGILSDNQQALDNQQSIEAILGEKIHITMSLQAIKFSENQGAFNYERYLLTEGYQGYGEIISFEKIESESNSHDVTNQCFKANDKAKDSDEYSMNKKIIKFRYRTHEKLLTFLQNAFGNENGSTYYSMLSGDKSKMSDEQLELYKSAGIMHLFAVSGLHFGLIFTLVYTIFKSMLPSNKSAAIVACILMFFYLWWIGYNYSAIRAFILIGLYYFSKFIHRPFDPICGLCFVHLVVLLINPFAMLSVSYTMSIMAYISITMIYPFVLGRLSTLKSRIGSNHRCFEYFRNDEKRYRLIKSFLGSLLLSFIVTICLNPVTSYYFQTTNEWSFIVNVFVVFLAGILLPLLIISIAISFVPIIGLIINQGLFFLINILGWMINHLVLFSTAVGFKTHDVPRGHSLIILMSMVFLLFVFQNLNIKKMIAYMSKRRVVSFIIVVLILANSSIWVMQKNYNENNVKITFLNVGHGDSAVMSYRDYHVLFDCGDISFDINKALYQLGIDEIDLLIVSHNHRDHYGNYKTLMDNGRIKEIIWPEDIITNRRYLIDGDLMIDLYRNYSDVEVNDNCIISHITYKNFDMLMTGDLSKKHDRSYVGSARVNEVLKIAHHGSAGSTSEIFLEHNPSNYGIISCSNKYNFPRPSLLDRLEKAEINSVITKYDGAVIISTNGENYWIQY